MHRSAPFPKSDLSKTGFGKRTPGWIRNERTLYYNTEILKIYQFICKPLYTQLRLDPLAPESADEFLEALLGDDPSLEPLKKLLIERTEGNPFFLCQR